MHVATHAPVVASSDTSIAAGPDVVWHVIADIPAWPRWNPTVSSIAMNGHFQQGTSFRWKAGPTTITSRLEEVHPPSMLGWTGRTLGIRAVHVYEFEPVPGGTVARTTESWGGPLASLFRRRLTRRLQDSLDTGLRALKDEAERRAGSDGTTKAASSR